MENQSLEKAKGIQLFNEEDKKFKEEMRNILLLSNEEFKGLFKESEKMRNKNMGNRVYIRASLEIGNVCENSCK